MSEADELTAFVTARLDEWEQWAQESTLDGRRFDRDQVLRLVASLRAILAEHAPGYPVTYPKPSGQPTCGVCHAGGWDWDPENWPCPTVRQAAAIFSTHPEYQERWKP